MILNDVRDFRPSSPALVSVLWASLVRVPLRKRRGRGLFPSGFLSTPCVIPAKAGIHRGGLNHDCHDGGMMGVMSPHPSPLMPKGEYKGV